MAIKRISLQKKSELAGENPPKSAVSICRIQNRF